MKMPLTSRVLFSLVGVYLPVAAHVADYSRTHIFNPRWPPHAKFHAGHTLMFSSFLGALTVYLAARGTSNKKEAIAATTAAAGMYFATQSLAILYPNTLFTDPDWDGPKQYILGKPAQLVVDVAALSVIAIAAVNAGRKGARWTA